MYTGILRCFYGSGDRSTRGKAFLNMDLSSVLASLVRGRSQNMAQKYLHCCSGHQHLPWWGTARILCQPESCLSRCDQWWWQQWRIHICKDVWMVKALNHPWFWSWGVPKCMASNPGHCLRLGRASTRDNSSQTGGLSDNKSPLSGIL